MKINFLILKYSLLILVVVLVSACSTATQTPPPPTETDNTQPYPAPKVSSPTLPYPQPMDPEEVVIIDTYVIPPAGTDTGVVIGQLIDNATDQPLAQYSVYLATKIAFQNSSEYSYALDPTHSPNTTSDSQGNFAIGDVKPGKYILMVWTPIQASVVVNADTGKEVDVVIVAGETLDVGTHKIANPMP